jgi:hypothetical protein
MADYPAYLLRERRLADGRTVTLRPMFDEDQSLMLRLSHNVVVGFERFVNFRVLRAPASMEAVPQ